MIQKISEHVSRVIEQWQRGAEGEVHKVYFPFRPVPASRPRVAKGGRVYFSPTTTEYTKKITKSLTELEHKSTDSPLSVLVASITEKPKAGKYPFPIGDVDNFAKTPLDCLTKSGKVWGDDRQIVSLISTKRYAAEDEECGVHIMWYEITGDNDD